MVALLQKNLILLINPNLQNSSEYSLKKKESKLIHINEKLIFRFNFFIYYLFIHQKKIKRCFWYFKNFKIFYQREIIK